MSDYIILYNDGTFLEVGGFSVDGVLAEFTGEDVYWVITKAEQNVWYWSAEDKEWKHTC